MGEKMGGSVENRAMNNLQVCNMAEMKYKVENK